MKKLLFISVLALLITACGDRIKPDDTTDENAADDLAAGGATAGGIYDGAGLGGTALEGGMLVSYDENAINDPNNVLSEKIVHFAFDSNAVGDDILSWLNTMVNTFHLM